MNLWIRQTFVIIPGQQEAGQENKRKALLSVRRKVMWSCLRSWENLDY